MNEPSFNIIFEEVVPYTLDNTIGLVELARKGVSKKSLLNLATQSKIPLKTITKLLPISERTLNRYANEDRLASNVSEHVILIAQVLLRAKEVLGSFKSTKIWVETPILGLGNIAPIMLLDTSFGSQLVIEELGRLEQGVYS